MLVGAIETRDYPVMQAGIVVFSLFVVLVNLGNGHHLHARRSARRRCDMTAGNRDIPDGSRAPLRAGRRSPQQLWRNIALRAADAGVLRHPRRDRAHRGLRRRDRTL